MSNRLVTGDALQEVLLSNKIYIDDHDFGFEDGLPDGTIDAPSVTFCKHEDIDETKVDDIINKFFKTE